MNKRTLALIALHLTAIVPFLFWLMLSVINWFHGGESIARIQAQIEEGYEQIKMNDNLIIELREPLQTTLNRLEVVYKLKSTLHPGTL